MKALVITEVGQASRGRLEESAGIQSMPTKDCDQRVARSGVENGASQFCQPISQSDSKRHDFKAGGLWFETRRERIASS